MHTACLKLFATKSKITNKCIFFRVDFIAIRYQHFADKIAIYMCMHILYIYNAFSIRMVYCMK